MSRLGAYSFLPWLRQGLANQIASADFDNNVKVRASVQVQLELRGEKCFVSTLRAYAALSRPNPAR